MRVMTDFLDTHRRQSTLVVLLPPAGAQLVDFYHQGFVSALRKCDVAVDVQLAAPSYQQVMTQSVATALHDAVVRPAHLAGYRHIWLVGISLGAFNALYYAVAHAELLAGILLLAPYPGTRDVLAEIEFAGGPIAWAEKRCVEPTDERLWWRWLAQQAEAGSAALPVHLGTGEQDRFVHGQRMMAGVLPAGRSSFLFGAHDWSTWLAVWQHWLNQGHLQ